MADIKVIAGDLIKLEHQVWGFKTGNWSEFTVEEFRNTLGIFEEDQHRVMGKFLPLCELYVRGPESEDEYMSNQGEYITNMVPSFIHLGQPK